MTIVNKTDLVNEAELDQLRDTIRYETTAVLYSMFDQIMWNPNIPQRFSFC